ncbi:MAG: isoprenyl transferase [Gemmatimonadota bacterium]|nr:MAG: isoprenyl transferase [Gemmatimonadota bacterium]
MTNRELELKQAIDDRVAQGARIPRHVAVIMDGNGRWAKARHLPRLAGHRAGVRPVRESVRACDELGVEVLTLYAFSVENWNRPKAEIAGLMQALKDTLRREQAELNENGVSLRTIGRTDDLPFGVRRQIEKTSAALAGNQGLILNLALSYGGRPEIVDAARAVAREVEAGRLKADDVDEATFARHLYTEGLPDPDLLIRTSGELRVSNFLLWQIAYAEIWVTTTPWPDFGREHLYSGILDYFGRARRFGRVETTSPDVALAGHGGKK